jgi:hypothetical protein
MRKYRPVANIQNGRKDSWVKTMSGGYRECGVMAAEISKCSSTLLHRRAGESNIISQWRKRKQNVAPERRGSTPCISGGMAVAASWRRAAAWHLRAALAACEK